MGLLNKSEKIFKVCSYLLVIVFALVTLYPIVYAFSVSISGKLAYESGLITLLPKDITLQAYEMVIESKGFWIAYSPPHTGQLQGAGKAGGGGRQQPEPVSAHSQLQRQGGGCLSAGSAADHDSNLAAYEGAVIMATTKILPVRKRLKDCLDYAANPKKTEIFRGDALDRLMHYTQNEDKTEHQLY